MIRVKTLYSTNTSQYISVKKINLHCLVLLMYVWEGGISAELEEVNFLFCVKVICETISG